MLKSYRDDINTKVQNQLTTAHPNSNDTHYRQQDKEMSGIPHALYMISSIDDVDRLLWWRRFRHLLLKERVPGLAPTWTILDRLSDAFDRISSSSCQHLDLIWTWLHHAALRWKPRWIFICPMMYPMMRVLGSLSSKSSETLPLIIASSSFQSYLFLKWIILWGPLKTLIQTTGKQYHLHSGSGSVLTYLGIYKHTSMHIL